MTAVTNDTDQPKSVTKEEIIRVTNLIKHYTMGDNVVRALDDVSFSIYSGEMVAITGPSGSGKSTLMNVLGCLDRPDQGDYILAGEKVSLLKGDQLAKIRNLRIGFVFQTFNLLPRINALQNVELPLLYAGDKKAAEKAKIALQNVGLGDRWHHLPNQLSGGQRQRVAVARALVCNPAIILADEPTGNLDSHTGEEIMQLFEALHEQGRTLIVVTHSEEIADRCKRRIHMLDGKLAVPPSAAAISARLLARARDAGLSNAESERLVAIALKPEPTAAQEKQSNSTSEPQQKSRQDTEELLNDEHNDSFTITEPGS